MVGAIAGDDLVPAGDHAGDLDGVLVRLGPAQGKECLLQVPGRDLG